MSRYAALLFLALPPLQMAAQAPQSPSSPQLQTRTPDQPAAKTPDISTGTQLVVVDVTVQDKDGHPVRNLKRSDFLIEESKKPQTTKSFDEHVGVTNPKPIALPKLPPGTFTDYTPYAEDTTLNVLLLDTLNTAMTDQAYVRNQLKQYVKNAKPGARVAIFGLTTHLILLQGFSTDPDVLKGAVEHRLIPRASVLLNDPTGSNTDPISLADTLAEAGASAATVANLQQFEAQNASFQTQIRIQYTLDAFTQMGRYLANFPGRKNLIWFSGSFPLTIFPDATLGDPFAVMNNSSDQLKQASNLLNRARVAVYPIDARGLQSIPVMDASRSGAAYARNPGRLTTDISNFNQNQAQEHFTMQQLAEDTGGHAFFNTNGLAEAVAKAIDTGANYYTLTYSPENRERKGEYRTIKVQLQGAAATQGLKLSYRHGYFADDPNAKRTTSSILTSAPSTGPVTGSAAYGRAAMERGSPAPSEILFKVRVLPTSKDTEDTIAPHNSPNPTTHGPYRRYQIDYAALANEFTFTQQSDGRRKGTAEFVVFVYDNNGKLLNIEGHTLGMNLPPDVYADLLKNGLPFSLQVSAPARSETFLRIAVHDIPSGRMGVVEIPTTTVEHLPPLPTPAK